MLLKNSREREFERWVEGVFLSKVMVVSGDARLTRKEE